MAITGLKYTEGSPSDPPVAVDDGASGNQFQIIKLGSPTLGEEALASAADPIPVRLSNGTAYISTLPVSVAATITISGTVTANAGTNLNTSALALENGGNLDTLAAVDFMTGTDFSTVLGTSSLVIATQADDVANTQDTVAVSAFGYVFDGTTWDRLRGDSTNGMLVNLGSNNDVTVSSGTLTGITNTITISGSVTANAGTNLNTSALALESGGNLAGAATSLAVMDDWDETNRAAVNLIASQVAITGGAGAVAANTPRVTLASDDPGVALLGTIDSDTSYLSAVDFALESGGNLDTLATTDFALESGGNLATAATLLGTIDADTSTLAAVDFMLGTDFSSVFGASSLLITTQGDDLANTQDTVATSALLYAFDGTTWDRMLGDSANGLLVNLGSNNDITGTVTANAGTNLNTSALALETGGNLAGAATSLAVLDDWDESDRAKVNLIAGQVAITGGAGAVAANTPRVTLADPELIAAVTVINAADVAPTLKNLSSGGLKLGDAVDNTSTLYSFGRFTLLTRGASAFSSGGTVSLWLLPRSGDGSNYEDGSDSVTPARPADHIFDLRAVSTQQYLVSPVLEIPAGLWKPLILNSGGQAFTNTDDENKLLFEAIHAE